MAYQSNIPQPTDAMSQSQSDLLNNFTEINNFVNVDHGPFNGPLQGMHVKVTLPTGANPPTNPFTADATGFFCALGLTANTIRQTYIHNTIAAGVQIDVPMSESVLATNATPGTSAGWSYLPSGILIKWGSDVTISGTLNINLNAGGQLGPNFSQTFNAQLSYRDTFSGTAPVVSGLSSSQLSLTSATASLNVYWFVIGRGV